jgi:hypothetical protein
MLLTLSMALTALNQESRQFVPAGFRILPLPRSRNHAGLC